MLNCKYCENERKDLVSLRNHERMCKSNPNRKLTPKNKEFYKTRKNSNQFLKAKELGLSNPIVSEETRSKISKKSKNHWTEEKRKAWSEKMKIQAQRNTENHPESYSYKNFCGRARKTLYKDEWMHSSWELTFAIWLDENNIKWTKKVRYFEYEWKGSIRKYFPDFYLPELEKYVEIKGYETDRDIAKWSAVPRIVVLKDKDIKAIKENKFNLGRVS
jgi:hypothetical protein